MKFCQPVRSSWAKQSSETYPKNFISQRENQFFGGKSLVGGGGSEAPPTPPPPVNQMAVFRYGKVCWI